MNVSVSERPDAHESNTFPPATSRQTRHVIYPPPPFTPQKMHIA